MKNTANALQLDESSPRELRASFIREYSSHSQNPEAFLANVIEDTHIPFETNLPKDQQIQASLEDYISRCTHNPHKVLFYIMQTVADGGLPESALKEFQAYVNVFPALEFVVDLKKDQCVQIMKSSKNNMRDFVKYFEEIIMQDERVLARIAKSAPEARASKNLQKINWEAMARQLEQPKLIRFLRQAFSSVLGGQERPKEGRESDVALTRGMLTTALATS